MKKLVSLLLIVTMVLSLFTIVPISVGAAQVSDVSVQADNGLYVKVGEDLYSVKKGETITYNYLLTVEDALKISSLDINMEYDTEGLDFLPFIDENGEFEVSKHFPNIYGGCVYNFHIDGKIYFNYSSVSGVRFQDNEVVFTGQFKVTADKGIYNINSKLVTLADSNMNKIVFAGENVQPDIYAKSTVLLGKNPVGTDNSEDNLPAPTKTIYFLNNVKWAYVNLYYWNSDSEQYMYWPGEQMQYVSNNGEYDIFSITIPQDVDNIIFNGYDPVKDLYKQTLELSDSEDEDCYYVVDDSHKNFSEVEKDNINNIIYIKPKHTYTVAGSLINEAGIFGTTWDPKNTANDLTYNATSGVWSITYTNVPASDDQWYEYVIAQDRSFDISYGATTGKNPQNGKFIVAENNSTVTIYFNGSTCWSKVTAPPAGDTMTIYFLNDKGLTDVKAYYWDFEYYNICEAWPGEDLQLFDDGGKYDIYCISIPEYADAIIFNGIDPITGENMQTNDLMYPQDGDCYYMVGKPAVNRYDSEKDHIISVIEKNVADEKTHTYTAVGDSSVFGSAWDVTDNKNNLTYNEKTKLWSITYENVAAIANGGYEYKIVEDHSWDKAFTDKGVDAGGAKNAEFEVSVDNSTVTIYFDGEKCWAEVVAPEIPTEETKPTEKPEISQETDGLYIKVGDSYYEAKTGEEYEFVYTLNTGDNKVCTVDARVEYDSEGLDFIPTYSENGDLDLYDMFPVLTSAVFNHTLDGMLYFNYASVNGRRFNNDDRILFRGKFKVTATEGVYEINPYIYCLEDENENIIVNEGKVLGEYKDNAYINYDGPCVKVGDYYYEAIQGEEYEFVYYLQVEDKKIESIDARVQYDTEGLDFVPTVDSYGDLDTNKMFPILKAPMFNHTIDGILYFNYVNLNGVDFSKEDSVLFRGKFKVTASSGVYEINPYIFCLEDTNTDIIVDEGVKYGDFKDNAVLIANYKLGDANRDGKVNVFDMTVIQRYAAEFIKMDKKQLEISDMNQDGIVNIFDATAISRYIAYGSRISE